MNARPPPVWRLREFESLSSTSDLCVVLAEAGEAAGLAVLAAQQTGARGSRGRTWQTLPGNLALSVLLRPAGPPSIAGHWALLAGIALAEALEDCGAPPIRLKWPNDALLDGRKLGGMLIDSAIEAGRLDWLVIGFGANLAVAPGLPRAIRLPQPVSPRAVTAALLDRLDHWGALSLREGFAPVRRAWLDRGPAPGAFLRITAGGEEVEGAFAGLSDTGALLLQSGGRIRAFSTGDVLQGA